MEQTIEQKNKALVLEAFDTLFNRKDFAAAEKFWSPNYIQHSAHIPPGRNGLFDLVRSAPATMKYENHLIMAEGDMLMLHGRFSGHGAPGCVQPVPGQMPKLLARFRDKLLPIWERHGIRPIGFWTKWTAFQNDPAWRPR